MAQALHRTHGRDGGMHPQADNVLVVLLCRQRVDRAGPGHLSNGASQAGRAELHTLESGIDSGLGRQIRRQPSVEFVVHQHRHQRVGPVAHNGDIEFPCIEQPGDVATIKITGQIQTPAIGIDQRIVVGGIDLALDCDARRV